MARTPQGAGVELVGTEHWPATFSEHGGSRPASSNVLELQVQRHLDETGTSDGVLDHAQVSEGRKRVARIGIEAGIESHIVVVGIKAGMVGNVEEIGRVLESEALGELRLLDDRRIRARLERTAKDVASAGGEGALNRIAEIATGSGGSAGRNAVLAGLQLRDDERRRIQERHTGGGVAVLLRSLGRKAGCQGDDRVGDEVIGAVVLTTD